MGLAVAGCTSSAERDKAEVPPSTSTTSTIAGIPAGDAAPGADGSPSPGVAPGGASSTAPASQGGAPSGGTGQSPTAPAAGAPSGTSTTQAPAPTTGSSTAPQPGFTATPEQCAGLRQVLAIVDDPELRRLAAEAGCG